MIVEAAVFVVSDDEQGFVPLRALHHRIHHSSDQVLPGTNIGWCAVVIVLSVWLIDEVGIDKRYGR